MPWIGFTVFPRFLGCSLNGNVVNFHFYHLINIYLYNIVVLSGFLGRLMRSLNPVMLYSSSSSPAHLSRVQKRLRNHQVPPFSSLLCSLLYMLIFCPHGEGAGDSII